MEIGYCVVCGCWFGIVFTCSSINVFIIACGGVKPHTSLSESVGIPKHLLCLWHPSLRVKAAMAMVNWSFSYMSQPTQQADHIIGLVADRQQACKLS